MVEAGLWRACWRSKTSAALTLGLLALLIPLAWGLAQWALVEAVWSPDATACLAARGQGACWGVIAEKHRLILFGRYPSDQHWRAALACLIVIGALFYAAHPAHWGRRLLALWGLALGLSCVLMAGRLGPWSLQAWGLPPVASDLWGGFPLTLMLSTVAITGAFPLAILLALGRSGPWPVIARLCAALIEVVRGVPLVSVLFMASFMLPLMSCCGSPQRSRFFWRPIWPRWCVAACRACQPVR
jgi:general L-amino acid transport system permease protein